MQKKENVKWSRYFSSNKKAVTRTKNTKKLIYGVSAEYRPNKRYINNKQDVARSERCKTYGHVARLRERDEEYIKTNNSTLADRVPSLPCRSRIYMVLQPRSIVYE